MARDPGSTWAPLPEAGAPDGYHKTQLLVHSTGTRASAAANRRYFSGTEVKVESTFIVGYSSGDPTLQIMDSTDKADANGSANRRAISIEVVGTGDEPFTDWQMSEIVRIGRWARANHEIPTRVCRTHDDPGHGWHVMFGAPGPWTTVRGKVCPGGRRIRQLTTEVFPRIFVDIDTPEVDDIPVAELPPALPEDDMVRTVRIGANSPHVFVADFGQRTLWRVPSEADLAYLRNVGILDITGPQPPQRFAGFRLLDEEGSRVLTEDDVAAVAEATAGDR